MVVGYDSWMSHSFGVHVAMIAATNDDTFKFLCTEQARPLHKRAHMLGGEDVTITLEKNHKDVKYIFGDMLGRAGKSKNPQKLHFHPRIAPEFVKIGVRHTMYPPKGALLSPIEPCNGTIQTMVAKWPHAEWCSQVHILHNNDPMPPHFIH